MSIIFCGHLCNVVECNINDIVTKSHYKEDHLHNLKAMVDIVRSHQQNLSLAKSLLGVSSCKFFGLMFTSI